LLVAGRGAVSACGLPELFIADHCQVKLNSVLCAVDIFLMQHTMREVYYIEIATFRSANICPYIHGVWYRHYPPPLPTYAITTFRKIRCKYNFSKVLIEYIYSEVDMSVKGSPIEIQTAAHWNLIGCTMTAPQAVLSPISILPPLSSYFTLIPARKN